MTVAELIEALQKFDGSETVLIPSRTGSSHSPFYVEQDFRTGDVLIE